MAALGSKGFGRTKCDNTCEPYLRKSGLKKKCSLWKEPRDGGQEPVRGKPRGRESSEDPGDRGEREEMCSGNSKCLLTRRGGKAVGERRKAKQELSTQEWSRAAPLGEADRQRLGGAGKGRHVLGAKENSEDHNLPSAEMWTLSLGNSPKDDLSLLINCG